MFRQRHVFRHVEGHDGTWRCLAARVRHVVVRGDPGDVRVVADGDSSDMGRKSKVKIDSLLCYNYF